MTFSVFKAYNMAFLLPAFSKFLQKHIQVSRFIDWLSWAVFNGVNFVGFPGGSDGKVSACNVGDPGSIPGSGRSLGEGNGNLAWRIPWTQEPGGQESDMI